MYRKPASQDVDAALFTCTTGVSPMILGLLLVGPLFLVGVGALTNAVGTMAVAALPFLAAFAVLLMLRRTTVVTGRTLTSRRFFGARTFPLEAVVRLAVPHPSGAALAATEGSRLAASLLLWDAQGAWFALPPQVPNAIVRGVVATALPNALRHAEALIDGGGRYGDADALSALDGTSLHGREIGLLGNVDRSASLETVASVDRNGRVELSDGGAPFLIAARDLILHELLRKRGVAIDAPFELSQLM